MNHITILNPQIMEKTYLTLHDTQNNFNIARILNELEVSNDIKVLGYAHDSINHSISCLVEITPKENSLQRYEIRDGDDGPVILNGTQYECERWLFTWCKNNRAEFSINPVNHK